MKSINRKDFIEVGSVTRNHGTKGEIRILLQQNHKFKEWVFLEIQGKPVPFYTEQVIGSAEEPILKLEGVTTPEQAQKLVGLPVLALGKEKKATKGKDINDALIGYLMTDEEAGDIGKIEELVELPQQFLFRVVADGNEWLIPAVDDFIIDINKRKKQIHVALPAGMLDI